MMSTIADETRKAFHRTFLHRQPCFTVGMNCRVAVREETLPG
jgi:hypothetical protein